MKIKVLVLIVLAFVAAGCAQGTAEITPPEIRYGEDVCAACKMIISDPRFAAAYTHEISPGRYENVLFDDIGDMLMHADQHPEHTVVAWWVHDYDSEAWLNGAEAVYVFSNALRTPMAQGTAAFASEAAAQRLAAELDGEVFAWSGLLARHQAGQLMVDAAGGAAMGHMAGQATHQAAAMPSAADAMAPAPAMPAGYQVELLHAAPLHAGYNPVTVTLAGPDGQPVAGAQVALSPQMSMLDGMHHGSGVVAPQQAEPGVYAGALIFSMPGGPDLGSWQVTAAFTDTLAGVSGSIPFPVEVAPSKVHGSFMGPDESRVFLSVVQPQEARVGRQPFEVYAMQRRGMFDWPPLDDLALEITPWMPTMDHGSPGNVNPVSQGDGRYLGQVNFSMAGPWTVTVVAKRGDAVLGEVVFEYTIP